MAVTTWIDQVDYAPAASLTVYGIVNGDPHDARILKIRRMTVFGKATGSGPVLRVLSLYKYLATITWAAGTASTPEEMDTRDTALDTVTSGSGGTPTTTGATNLFRSWVYSMDYPVTGGYTTSALEAIIPLGVIFDAGYHDAAVQPMVLNNDQGMFLLISSIYNLPISVFVEFTDEAV